MITHFKYFHISSAPSPYSVLVGRLAPEWPELGRTWVALIMDVDTFCKLNFLPSFILPALSFGYFHCHPPHFLFPSALSIHAHFQTLDVKIYMLSHWLAGSNLSSCNCDWWSQEDDYGSEEVEHLKSLVSNLRQLLGLYNKYNCRLSLSVFEKVCVKAIWGLSGLDSHLVILNVVGILYVIVHGISLYLPCGYV